ncbi:MAG: SRPBCC domain-containing protein [Pseudomonadota bacterium]
MTVLDRPAPDAKPDFVLVTYIRCSHDALWDALTSGEAIAAHHFAGLNASGDLKGADDRQVFSSPQGPVVTHRAVEVDPKSRLAFALHPDWSPDVPVSYAVFRLEAAGPAMRLTMEHWGKGPCGGDASNGWSRFAASLKSWLETGNRLHVPMSGEAA